MADRLSQVVFCADERLQLIGEPLGQSFCVQLDVPMDDDGILGRHEVPDVVRRHIQRAEDPDHTGLGFPIGIGLFRPHRGMPI